MNCFSHFKFILWGVLALMMVTNVSYENPGSTDKTYQGAAALGVDVILALVLVPDQSCYPGVGILLKKAVTNILYVYAHLCLSAPDNPGIIQVACQPTAASSKAVDCREGKSSDGQVGRVLGEERLLVLLPAHVHPVKPFHYRGLRAIA